MTLVDEILVRRLGRVDYAVALERMRAFTSARAAETPDELWLLEHPPVYTLGQGAAQPQHAVLVAQRLGDREAEPAAHRPQTSLEPKRRNGRRLAVRVAAADRRAAAGVVSDDVRLEGAGLEPQAAEDLDEEPSIALV